MKYRRCLLSCNRMGMERQKSEPRRVDIVATCTPMETCCHVGWKQGAACAKALHRQHLAPGVLSLRDMHQPLAPEVLSLSGTCINHQHLRDMHQSSAPGVPSQRDMHQSSAPEVSTLLRAKGV
eukprot:scaffold148275_cov22-Tisochrysis_lutea.AAC.2